MNLFIYLSIHIKVILYTILAPGHYQNEKLNTSQTPSYSFGLKLNQKQLFDTPGIYYIYKIYAMTAQ